VQYLGLRLTPEGILLGFNKFKADKDAEVSKCKEVRQFKGLCNFLRDHIKNFVQVASPLYHLQGKESKWKKTPIPEKSL
jgi:hypothetical protein